MHVQSLDNCILAGLLQSVRGSISGLFEDESGLIKNWEWYGEQVVCEIFLTIQRGIDAVPRGSDRAEFNRRQHLPVRTETDAMEDLKLRRDRW